MMSGTSGPFVGVGVLTPEEIHAHFRQADPNTEMPPTLMEQEDQNKDGVVSREEFGGPRMEWEMCVEMLYQNPRPTALGLSVRWLCQRDRGREQERSLRGQPPPPEPSTASPQRMERGNGTQSRGSSGPQAP